MIEEWENKQKLRLALDSLEKLYEYVDHVKDARGNYVVYAMHNGRIITIPIQYRWLDQI